MLGAELLAINATLMYCLQLESKHVCISYSLIQNLPWKASLNQYAFHIAELRILLIQLRHIEKYIVFHWTPAHCGMQGSERTDAIAKAASELPTQLPCFSVSKVQDSSEGIRL